MTIHTYLISSWLIAPLMSCLFAKMRTVAPASLLRCCQIALLQENAPHILAEQIKELVTAILHPHAIRRIDYPDDRVILLKVVAPVRPKRALPAYIPCE